MGIDKIKVGDVQKWLNTLPVSKSTQGDIATLLLMCFRWAEGEDLIAVNPLRKLKKPACESRGTKAMISPADHLKLMGAATPALRSILLFLHETGCRPSEATRLTATNIDFANHVIILHEHKTDHTGKPRLIVLTPTIRELLSELVAVNPNGPLMRNARGGSWTKNSLGLAFRRACKIANVNAIAYGYRHTYATDALASGVPDATVAALLGHSSTTMLHKHYSHISSRTDVLRNAALKVRG